MIESLDYIRDHIVVFLVLISAIVFVHELGHYLVARHFGVRVEIFSIGFGPELFGWNARNGTRWRISLLPLGGYVKMFGELGVGEDGADRLAGLTAAERRIAYGAKPVHARAAIAAAGPAANFLFAIVVLAGLFAAYGQPRTLPEIGEVQAGSAAEAAGLEPGDMITQANGEPVATFQDLQRIVRLTVGGPVALTVERGGARIDITVQPRLEEVSDGFGNKQRVPVLGVMAPASATTIVKYTPVGAVGAAAREIAEMVGTSLQAVGQMVMGQRSTEQLSGVIGISERAAQAARMGVSALLVLAVYISVNLGLVNLFPIPLLDGGHLLFYGVEAVLGRPLGQRAQEYGFRVGLVLVLALMVLATGNDLGLWKFLREAVS